MKHVFISYAREDREFALEMSHRLRESRVRPWQDLRNLVGGDSWQETVDTALRNAAALIVIISPHASRSQYVTYEWAFALGAGVRVIPVLYKETRLHPRLKSIHYIDFASGRGTPWIDLRRALPFRAAKTQVKPELNAWFSLVDDEPEIDDDGDYSVRVGVVKAPRNAQKVTYELHDETLKHSKWTTKAAATQFASQFWSNGDLLVTATINTPKREIKVVSSLYDALRRGHRRGANSAVKRALKRIGEYATRRGA